MAGESQLRGWKEIAAFLGTSVRTAKRWEGERALPVRRLPGGARELVFAVREELEVWRRAEPARPDGAAAPALEPDIQASGNTTGLAEIRDVIEPPARPIRRRRVLVSGAILALAGLAVCAIWIMGWPGRVRLPQGSDPQPQTTRPHAADVPAPMSVRFVQLDLSRPDGWTSTIRVADGGAAQVGPSSVRPTLILRPRIVPAGLMLEIARADGKPVKDQGPASQPFVLLLDRNVTVRLRDPYPFSVRWAIGDPLPR